MIYHSAVVGASNEEEAEPMSLFESSSLVAFQCDFQTEGLSPRFDSCDVLFAEPPWRQGFEEFNSRAGVSAGRTYEALMARIDEEMASCGRPAYVLVGVTAQKLLPSARGAVPVRIGPHKGRALMKCYGPIIPTETPEGFMHNGEVLALLARKYKKVGDWCCGYGYSGRVFLSQGREAVLSDYNAKCIGYIANNYQTWLE